MPGLFDPIEVRGTTVRNRLWVSPMCQYSVPDLDGVPTDWHLVHLGSLAAGGAGVVMTEATAVTPEGRISPRDTGIWNDAQADAWQPITAFIRSQGAVPAIQLAHAGRKASTAPAWGTELRGSVSEENGGWQTVSSSPIAFEGLATPRELSLDELPEVVAAFAQAAARAVRAGFEIIEIHAAHGYLLHQFLSPLSNLRADGYGGTLEQRARLLLEVVEAVRAAVGDKVPVLVRFSATDWAEGGWDAGQTAIVAAWAREAGADLFDISTGGLVAHQEIPLGPGYQVPFADEVSTLSDVPVSTVGLITTAEQADAVVREGFADVVMMGRELLRDPHVPLRAAHELGVELDYWPGQYLRARWS